MAVFEQGLLRPGVMRFNQVRGLHAAVRPVCKFIFESFRTLRVCRVPQYLFYRIFEFVLRYVGRVFSQADAAAKFFDPVCDINLIAIEGDHHAGQPGPQYLHGRSVPAVMNHHMADSQKRPQADCWENFVVVNRPCHFVKKRAAHVDDDSVVIPTKRSQYKINQRRERESATQCDKYHNFVSILAYIGLGHSVPPAPIQRPYKLKRRAPNYGQRGFVFKNGKARDNHRNQFQIELAFVTLQHGMPEEWRQFFPKLQLYGHLTCIIRRHIAGWLIVDKHR